MDNLGHRGNQTRMGLNQSASRLPPSTLRKLGDQLSAGAMIDGPCWESVAHELNVENEQRQTIKIRAEKNKECEGFILLQHWVHRDECAHTLSVLKHALDKCNRPDIMTIFNEGVEEMNTVSLHVAIVLDSCIPDVETREHSIKVDDVHISDSLIVALRGHINTRDYVVSIPEWATWQTPAGDLRGKHITLVKKCVEETFLKEVEDRFQEMGSTARKEHPFVPNIFPSTSMKILNTDELPDTDMPRPDTEDHTYMTMSGCSSVSNNLTFEQQEHSPDHLSRFVGTSKRPHPCERSDEDSGSSLEDFSVRTVTAKSPENSPPTRFSPSSPVMVPQIHDSSRRNTFTASPMQIEPRLPDPDISLSHSPLTRRASEPANPTSTRSWRRVRSQVFISRATKSFENCALQGWHGPLTMEKMEQMMKEHVHHNGWYVIWIYYGETERDHKLVISVTHEGKLLHYNIRARAIDSYINYYLYKNVYTTGKVVHLIDYYKKHSLENPENNLKGRDVRLLHPLR